MGGMFREMGWDDREVTIKKSELLAVLIENREKHIAAYKEACEGYRDKVLERLDAIFAEAKDTVSRLKDGQVFAFAGFAVNLPMPQNHSKSYDQIIRMMEMSVEENIKITAGQFACFVQDDWEWKSAWSALNSSYSKSPMR